MCVLAAVLDDALDQRIRRDAAVAAMLELHVGAGDFPAVVLAADQIFRRHAHVVEEHRVLDAHHQIHVLDRDAGKVRRDVQPAEILMAFALRIGADQGPEIIRRQMMADHDLLAVDDIVIAVANRFGLAVGDVAAAVRFGEHLPDANFARL